jgi:hypothetical protein
MQHHAMVFSHKYPNRFHIIRFEDLVADRHKTMSQLADRLGIAWDNALLNPSWNGQPLADVYPWGTIRRPTTEANIATMNELNADQKERIKTVTLLMLPHFGYEKVT